MIHLGHISPWWLVLAFYLGLLLGFVLASMLAVSGRISREEEARDLERLMDSAQLETSTWEHG